MSFDLFEYKEDADLGGEISVVHCAEGELDSRGFVMVCKVRKIVIKVHRHVGHLRAGRGGGGPVAMTVAVPQTTAVYSARLVPVRPRFCVGGSLVWGRGLIAAGMVFELAMAMWYEKKVPPQVKVSKTYKKFL